METVGLEWTVLTWNLQGSKRTDLDEVARVIRNEAPDAVALQEVRKPQAATLTKALTMHSIWAEKHYFLRPLFPSRTEGAAILTPHEIVSSGDVEVSANVSKRSYKRRILQFGTVQRPDASAYRIYNVHFSPNDLVAERRAEAGRIARLVESHGESPPAVILGDFNDHGEPDIIAALPGVEHLPAPPTNPANAATQAIDHVLLPAVARDVSVSVPAGGPEWGALSDHLPVTVRFTLDWVQGGFAS